MTPRYSDCQPASGGKRQTCTLSRTPVGVLACCAHMKIWEIQKDAKWDFAIRHWNCGLECDASVTWTASRISTKKKPTTAPLPKPEGAMASSPCSSPCRCWSGLQSLHWWTGKLRLLAASPVWKARYRQRGGVAWIRRRRWFEECQSSSLLIMNQPSLAKCVAPPSRRLDRN